MKRLAVALFVTTLTATQAFATPAPKIAVVDLQRAVTECRDGVDAKAELLKKTEQYNADLKVLLADFEKMRAEAEKDAAKLTADERAEREKLLQKKSREFQNRQREAQEEVKQIEADHLKRITTRLGAILARIGEDGEYTAILDRNNGVFYTDKEADLTPQLVKLANERSSKGK
jgi:Skp family chaperone for outer membrane proteins